jgi:predicted nucleic acid-binding protein
MARMARSLTPKQLETEIRILLDQHERVPVGSVQQEMIANMLRALRCHYEDTRPITDNALNKCRDRPSRKRRPPSE